MASKGRQQPSVILAASSLDRQRIVKLGERTRTVLHIGTKLSKTHRPVGTESHGSQRFQIFPKWHPQRRVGQSIYVPFRTIKFCVQLLDAECLLSAIKRLSLVLESALPPCQQVFQGFVEMQQPCYQKLPSSGFLLPCGSGKIQTRDQRIKRARQTLTDLEQHGNTQLLLQVEL